MWNTQNLVHAGDSYLEKAVASEADDEKRSLVKAAEVCYEHAYSLNKLDYSVHLGLGVASLMMGRLSEDLGRIPSSFIVAAKKHLGRAFLLSQGHLETIYYLAEVAMAEGNYQIALDLSKPLVEKDHKGRFALHLLSVASRNR